MTCACFSHDSVYVAIGDMAGLVKVWKVDSKEEVWTFDIGADLEVSWFVCRDRYSEMARTPSTYPFDA